MNISDGRLMKPLPMSRYAAITFLAALLVATHGTQAADLGDCEILASGSATITAGHACPGTPPFINVTATYRCRECGDLGPLLSNSASGFGVCVLDIPCRPRLLYINFGLYSMRIKIQNQRQLSGFCVDHGTTTSDAYCLCPSCNPSPIIIGLRSNDVALSGVEDGVEFDLTATGTPRQTAWTLEGSEVAFLALDRNGNWLIDDGAELFGDHTAQPVTDVEARNGFEALAVFDDSLNGGNEDGVIDENDEIYGELILWTDQNHNGVSEPEELDLARDAGVESIDLSYRPVSRLDANGNEYRYASRVLTAFGPRTAWDVFLSRE